ncbi:uncharacterized protein LOC126849129 [Cataglyphis hispanica]|uniref:uncharacterized protein LOC126849129 n=1 Tax=Cataglyphis hispanica TaxID=1086592 RepID=UPI00218009FC|nr:uncharacterized protein LOC126849129 [Cataglyphis hispanica]
MVFPFSLVYKIACISDSSSAGFMFQTAYVQAFKNSCNLCRDVPSNLGIIVLASFNVIRWLAWSLADTAILRSAVGTTDGSGLVVRDRCSRTMRCLLRCRGSALVLGRWRSYSDLLGCSLRSCGDPTAATNLLCLAGRHWKFGISPPRD